MNTVQIEEKDKNARENAEGWLESIREMVGKLSREGAAEAFAGVLTADKCIEILSGGAGVQADEDGEPTGDNFNSWSIEELHEAVRDGIVEETLDRDEFEFDEESARQTIEESVLSVEVRSDWYTPGDSDDDARKPTEFNILLTTGGPALRLMGELDEHGQPTRAWLEYQDWGTAWTHYYVEGAGNVLLEFASAFYFGE